MKKIIILILLIFTFFGCFDVSMNASEIDASINGFTSITGFEYVDDKQTDLVYIEGSTYQYGYISLRTFYYEYRDIVNDNMYYLIMSKATIHGNGKQSIGFYSSKSLEITYTLKDVNSTIQCYGPEPELIGLTVTEGFDVSGSLNTDLEGTIQIGYSHQTAVSYEVASETVSQGNTESGFRFIKFKIDFIGYEDNRTSVAPYVGEYVFRSSAVFKIHNYSQTLSLALKDFSYMTVKLVGEISKDSIWSDNIEEDEIEHSYYNSGYGRSIN